MLGGIDLAHIIWKSSRVVTQREILRANGYTEALLREQLTSIEPGSYLPSRTGGSAFVIGARYDTVIPRESTEALIGDLPGAKSLWLPTGHYGGVFVQHRLLNEVSRFFAAGFSGQTYTPPAKVLAPTVRLGGEMNSSTGFNIEIGLDLLRPSGTKSPFASFLVSPRGAKLFFGQGIDRGVAIGVTVSGQRPGIGMLWSTVL